MGDLREILRICLPRLGDGAADVTLDAGPGVATACRSGGIQAPHQTPQQRLVLFYQLHSRPDAIVAFLALVDAEAK